MIILCAKKKQIVPTRNNIYAGYFLIKAAIPPLSFTFGLFSGSDDAAFSGFLKKKISTAENSIATMFTISSRLTPFFSTAFPMIADVTAKLAEPRPLARPYIMSAPAF